MISSLLLYYSDFQQPSNYPTGNTIVPWVQKENELLLHQTENKDKEEVALNIGESEGGSL